MPIGVFILSILYTLDVLVDARVTCDLECGESATCRIVRSTCDYPPCPRVPVCVGVDSGLASRRPGHCPMPMAAAPCVTQCRRDGDCRGEEKCCFNGCGRTCRGPLQNVSRKPGTCPWHLQRELLCSVDCGSDQDCPGVEKCCTTSCGSICSKPCYHWLRGTGTRSGFWSLPYICQRS
ncbi:WAP four-disulfide core domain protein 2-like [Pecten maximus]|uniref:WAP four-disulfide core domain protein 2-like n=1 Tax=Pecten maximus TaxID=6579 RepID=UPI0014589D06|nr:WAP four-disulfide core domain protein 2-like [Pecten maximus]